MRIVAMDDRLYVASDQSRKQLQRVSKFGGEAFVIDKASRGSLGAMLDGNPLWISTSGDLITETAALERPVVRGNVLAETPRVGDVREVTPNVFAVTAGAELILARDGAIATLVRSAGYYVAISEALVAWWGRLPTGIYVADTRDPSNSQRLLATIEDTWGASGPIAARAGEVINCDGKGLHSVSLTTPNPPRRDLDARRCWGVFESAGGLLIIGDSGSLRLRSHEGELQDVVVPESFGQPITAIADDSCAYVATSGWHRGAVWKIPLPSR